MATHKFSGRSISFGSVSSVCNKRNSINQRTSMDDLMAILVRRHRAKVCLRAQGAHEEQAANCTCVFCSAETQRERFGVTLKEMRAIDEEKVREQTRYVRGMLAYEQIRHDRRKSIAVRGLR